MRVLICVSILVLVVQSMAFGAENWPHWRGPNGNGVSPETNLPVTFSESVNVAWRAELGGTGVSTPIVVGDLVIATSQAGRGVVRPGNHPTLGQGPDDPDEKSIEGDQNGEVRFQVEAFDRRTGERQWRFELNPEAVGEGLQPVHRKHNLASSSPVSDGVHVFAWFGTGQLVALTMDGQLAWEKHLAKDYGPFDITWGHSSSPTVYENKLLLLCDHEPESYLLALDKSNGREIWKADRGSGLRSYSTPTIVDSANGPEVIVNSSKGLDAYDPDTGDRKWFYPEDNRFPIPAPSFGDGIIFTSRGYRSGPYMAIRPGGEGDITDTEYMIWYVATGAPYVSAVVQYDGIVYLASDAGILQAADAKTGERLWQSRTGGVFSASPVAGDGKVYFASETGEILVLAAGRKFELLSSNDMAVRFLASPIISGGQLFLRTDGEIIAVKAD